MKRLYLSSTVEWPGVAASIYRRIGLKHIRMPFIMTPAEVLEEDMSWLEDERKMLRQAGFDIFDYTITGKSMHTIKEDLSNIDSLYVSGGNEYYFKYQCNQTGFGQFIEDWINSGQPYLGSSAGSQILAPDFSPAMGISSTEVPGIKIDDYKGLGLVDFLVIPHWGGDTFRKQFLHESFEHMYQLGQRLICLNNYEFVEVLGDKYRIIDVRHE